MGRLELSLLGTPEVRHAGQVLTFPTRKVLALLLYLVVEGGLHAREKLTALFWPESEEERARASFRRALALLRQEVDKPPGSSHLLIRGDRIGVDFTGDVACDLHPFQAAVLATYEAASSPCLLRASLQSAATLYRGEFLESFALPDAPDFDDWVREQREYWHRRMEDLFARLSQVQEEAGALADALETASRWRRFAPFTEQPYTRLMRLHFAAGDRGAALRVYADCQAMLTAEFHTMPTPETEALARRIRSQAPPALYPSPGPGSRRGSLSPFEDAPLVGREREAVTLRQRYHAASHHQTQVVTLLGEAGIGKTRLATEFLTWAAAQGADILQGRAFETEGRLPYQPLLEALRRRLERENAPDDLLSDVWLAELTRLLPELRERYPDLPLPFTALEEAEARAHLFEAVARLFQALAERAPLLLVLDDLQWADVASLDLLQYLARDWAVRGVPVLVLLCLREEALAHTPTLSDWLSSLGRALPLTRLRLLPLAAEDILRLVSALGSRGKMPGTRKACPDPELERLGQWLFAETAGHPFFLVETLKTLLEQGQLTRHLTASGTWGIALAEAAGQVRQWRTLLPSGVRDLIRARLARLSPEARGLLAGAAVLGQGFTFEHLAQVAQMAEQDALQALEEVLKSGLLQETSTTGSPAREQPYTFAHDKIREVVYAEVGKTRRRCLHRRVLEVLQQTAAPAAPLAHHQTSRQASF
jgi:DNA-binding SARP family transcriptional activator